MFFEKKIGTRSYQNRAPLKPDFIINTPKFSIIKKKGNEEMLSMKSCNRFIDNHDFNFYTKELFNVFISKEIYQIKKSYKIFYLLNITFA